MAVPGRRLVVASTFLLLLSVLEVAGTEEIDQRIVVVPDKTFNISKATHTHNVKSTCQCKMTCFVLGSACVSWSYLPTGSSCQISNLGPEDLDLTAQSGAVYVYKLWPDGLTYIMWKDEKFTFAEMKAHCAKIPYFRLIILKTSLQFQFAIDTLAPLCGGALLDLIRISTDGLIPDALLGLIKTPIRDAAGTLLDVNNIPPGSLVWGDGTIMPDKFRRFFYKDGIHKYLYFQFIIRYGFSLDYAAKEGTRPAVCQSEKNLWV
ncbi:hypothetical protein Pmani_023689 [Petrolisthes manimaculis]|uniref:Apple domain-containing protein n=1 Tax=Petrolisthes manimaculis TaxID=1843537 RepID=A0AAE1PBI7_9EUCA|nr:hypothetical protein Pmani_023689 [Petrolisthes manimaculis]